MSSFQIIGGQKLEGTIRTAGSKNATLPALAASLLFEETLTLTNVPDIVDVRVMIDILRELGKIIDRPSPDTVVIRPGTTLTTTIPADLAKRLRASNLLLGPLVSRFGHVELPEPGGDLIGRRPIDYHLAGLRQMGAKADYKDQRYQVSGKLHGQDIYLEEATVTGTENLVMAAVLAQGKTVLRNAAQEQHIGALVVLLKEAGVEIDGLGSSTLTITGRAGQPLNKAVSFRIPPDELDAGTFAIAALLTDGRITIEDYPIVPLRSLTEKLLEVGGILEFHEDNSVTVSRDKSQLKAFKLRVGFAPGFPTDLQPPMAVLATQANGVSLIHDWIYERRFGYTEELVKFGANITVCDPHRVTIAGPTPLIGRRIYSLDIRAGIAFVLSALVAEGTSVIDHADIIDRGYATLDQRLQSLGATITRQDE